MKRFPPARCGHCGETFIPSGSRQRWCPACKIDKQRESARKYYERLHPVRRAYNAANRFRKIPGLTFEFIGGKWYWRHENGLNNGPFGALRDARKDAARAL